MGIVALGYLGLGVKDLDRWRKFATTDVLGFEEMGTAPDGTLYLRMDEYHHRFAVRPSGEDDVIYVGWEVANAQDIDVMANRLRTAGVNVTEGTPEECANRKVVRLIKFQDPAGSPLEIFHGALQLWEQPFKPSRSISGFKTKTADGQPMGLGHMILFQKDLKAAIPFYRDLLGLKISDYIDLDGPMPGLGVATFFHVNPRHHSIALIQVPAPKHLQHFMVELNNLDDIGQTYYKVQEIGVPLSLTLGRHTNDHMLSFYMQSPSGFDIEYGWGGRLIDDSKWVVQQHVAAATWGHQVPKRAPVQQPVQAG